MAAIKWLPEALEDVDRFYKFLENKDRDAAARAASCILEGVSILRTAPRVGRQMPDENRRRELFIAFGAGAYVIRYRLETDDTVVIIRVWHNREDR